MKDAGEKDRGAALITVMVLGAVMLVLIATGLTVAGSGMSQAVSVQKGTSAMDAAYAGVDDYVARLNVDSTYVKYANRGPAFAIVPPPTALPTPANPAFGIGPTGTWATVPGSNGSATFRYEVDSSQYAASGTIRLRSTGRAGDRTVSLLASIRVRGFVDFAYFTDYELQDPQTTGQPQSCVKYAWQGRASNCGNIQFQPGDTIYGDVHSNDTMRICGSTFVGDATTSNPGGTWVTPSGCARGSVSMKYAAVLPMPSTNSAMKTDAACLYTGPTRITYNADGTMTVVSPWTKFTKVTGTTGSNPTKCGDRASLNSAQGARVQQLDHDMLYVQNVPAVATDPNYSGTAAGDMPAGLTCIGSDGTATTATDGIGWKLTTTGTTVRYPLAGESPATGWTATGSTTLWNTALPAYGCRNGDLFVQGTVTTMTTAASNNYVYVTSDLTDFDRTQDLLGLVGQNGVIVWNPMQVVNGADDPMLTDYNRRIDAAMVSVAHTFQVQNYDRGATRGTLGVFGSIAQKFRGPTLTRDPNTGYDKAYQYDPLLKTNSPPKFLASSATNYEVTRYATVPQAFNANGDQQP